MLPPLSLFFDGVHFWLVDGFHRYHAYLQAGGVERISAEIRTGSRRDAVLYAVGANTAHGLRRTNADKRRAVQMVLDEPEWAAWSDREIARVCAVAVSFVGDMRTVTRNGTTYQQKVKAKPAATPAMEPPPPGQQRVRGRGLRAVRRSRHHGGAGKRDRTAAR